MKRRNGKNSSAFQYRALCLAIASAFAPPVAANPTGAVVVHGSAALQAQGSLLTVTSSPGAIINWQSFSIGAGETTRFIQQSAASTVLNRVTGADPSVLLGSLSSNGRVFLINPAGILVGQSGRIDVAGFVASTLNLSNENFLAGNARFDATLNAGPVQNLGEIRTPSGGTVHLLGSSVNNTGLILAPGGEVILGAGESVHLVDSSTPGVKVEITGSPGDVVNVGQILAAGGRIGLVGAAIANRGLVDASDVVREGGRIFLRATRKIDLGEGGSIKADGVRGGEIVARVDRDGELSGQLTARGELTARGDGSPGSGGFVETSAAKVDLNGVSVDTGGGGFLIDPHDFTIAASGGDMTGTALSSLLALNDTIIQSSGGSPGTGDIHVNDAVSWSSHGLTLTAARDINLNAVMTASGTSTLTLNTATANGGDPGVAGGTVRVGFNAGGSFKGRVDFPGRSGSGFLTINGQAYTVIKDLGVEASTTGTDLQGMSGNLGGYFALGSDIDATATAGWNAGAGFTPVGDWDHMAFYGSFDGLGHTIAGLTVNRPSIGYIGLFGISTDAVRNVGLVGGSFIGNYSVGSVSGLNWGTISNSYATANVTDTGGGGAGGLAGGSPGRIEYSHAAGAVSGWAAGGLVGTITNGGSVESSYATGAVTGNNQQLGGLVGYLWDGIVNNSYATGNVTGRGSYIGGLLGGNNGTISNSYATGAVTAAGVSLYVGGLVGANAGTVTRSYSTGAVAADASDMVGGLAGYSRGSVSDSYTRGAVSITGGTTNAGGLIGFHDGVTLANSHYDIDSSVGTPGNTVGGLYHAQFEDWRTHGLVLNIADYFTADGAGYYTVSNLQGMKNLLAFAGNSAYKFRLVADIDLASVPDYSIGKLAAAEFDGNGHVLANLTIAGKGNNVGLFGRIVGTTVKNLGLTNVSISGLRNVGALAGANDGTVTDSFATGVVSTTSAYAGGLVGWNSGTITASHARVAVSGGAWTTEIGGLVGGNEGTIRNSFSTGSVTVGASAWGVGGLVGANYYGDALHPARIENSYATGAVNAAGASNVGGLVGWHEGSVSNSYATGQVSGSGYVGGLVGGNAGSVSSSYAVGAVSGSIATGGLIGDNSGGTVTHSYWDRTVNSAPALDNGVGTGFSTAQMKQQAAYDSGWDFTTVWSVAEGVSYPTLRTTPILTNTWIGAIDGGWWTPGNWSLGHAPVSTEAVSIPNLGGAVGLASGVLSVKSLNASEPLQLSGTGTVLAIEQGGSFAAGLQLGAGTALSAGGALSLSGYSLGSGARIDLPGSATLTVGGTAYTLIRTLAQLQNGISQTGRYALGGDIDAAATAGWNAGAGFLPYGILGSDGWWTPFAGVFDGLGHTITGLTVNRPGSNQIGLFGSASSAIIRNVNLADVNIVGAQRVGGLVGYSEGGLIENAAILSGSVTGNRMVGGVVGYNVGAAIGYSSSAATVVGNGGYGNDSIGGLVGYNNWGGSISHSQATGNVTSATSYVGGLVGYNDQNTQISDSAASGAVSGTYYVGGLAGYNRGTIQRGWVSGSLTATGSAGVYAGNGGNYGDSHYNIDTTLINGTRKILAGGLYNRQFLDLRDKGSLDVNDYFSADADGYLQIADLEGMKNLFGVADRPGYRFRLTADLDLASLSGYYVSNLAAAEFDGAGHTLSNLYIDLPGVNRVGLFGQVASGTVVKNLGLLNANVTGQSSVGMLAGYNAGSLSDVYSMGIVAGYSEVGGLVGRNESGSIRNAFSSGGATATGLNLGGLVGFSLYGLIENSSATGTVDGSANQVGGLVGHSRYGDIRSSFASGSVSGRYDVGGLVGVFAVGTIADSYATGNVTASYDRVGGLLGNASATTISGSHASGSVTARASVAGLVGYGSGGVRDSYSTGAVIGADAGGLVADGTLITLANSHYDVDQVLINGQHRFTEGGLYGTQFQDWRNGTLTIDAYTGAGKSFTSCGTRCYMIGSLQGFKHLVPFADDASLTFRLDADIDLAAAPGLYIPQLSAALFDGMGHTVSNLSLNRPSAVNVGLFGSVAAGTTIANLGVINADVTADSNVGALAGMSEGTISNSYSSGRVTGTNGWAIGGLVGNVYGSSARIDHSHSTATVSGGANTDDIGGLVGWNDGTISNSHATGAVSGGYRSSEIGGLVGGNGGTIRASYATGAVSGGDSSWALGGLVGANYSWGNDGSGAIENSYATGTVTGGADSWDVGGLAGWNDYGSIAGSYATGAVSGQGDIGGLIGGNQGSIGNSYAAGTVTGDEAVGGLAGWNGGTVTKAYAVGAVSGSSNVGGLVGDNADGAIAASYWNTGSYSGGTVGIGSADGATGLTSVQMRSAGSFADWDLATVGGSSAVWRIYEGQSYPLLRSFLTPLTVTATNATRSYDGTAYSGGNGVTYSVADAAGSGNLLGALAFAGTSQGAVNAGTYTLVPGGLHSNQQGYDIGYANGSLTISTAALTLLGVGADNKTKTYGSADPTFTYTLTSGSLAAGDAFSGSLTRDPGENVGTYDIRQGTLSAGPNYTINFANGRLDITRAPLSVRANDAAKTYDGQPWSGGNGVTYSGFVNSETPAVLGGAPLYSGSSQGARNAGSYGIVPSGFTSGNYAITYTGGTLTVDKATLGLSSVTAADKVYDGTTAASLKAYTLHGRIGTDEVSLAGSAAFADKNAGTGKTVNITGLSLSGADAGNYSLASSSASATADITPAPLIVKVNDAVKTYDGQLWSGGNGVTYSGFVNGETVDVLAGTLAYGGTAQGARNAGSYGIAASGLASGNYAITYADGTLTINAAALILGIAADNKTKTYGSADPVFTHTLTSGSLVAGDSLSGSLSRDPGENVGAYAIRQGTLSAGANYTINFAGGTLDITPAALTVRANDAVKTYDGQLWSGGNGVTYSGFVNGETAGVLAGTLAYGGTAQGARNAGRYGIAPSGLMSGNYAITYVDGTLTVDRAALTVSGLTATNKTYDGTTVAMLAGGSLGGVVAGDSVTVTGGRATFADKNVGRAKPVTIRDITLGGADAGNYILSGADFAATADITAAPLSVVGLRANSKVYDGTTAATLDLSAGRLAGAFGTDAVAVLVSEDAQFADKNAGPAKIVTPARITLTGADAGNYVLQPPPGLTADITPARLTVAAEDARRVYGDPNPAFTALITGFVAGEGVDALSARPFAATAATQSSGAGRYSIMPQGGAAQNYVFDYAGGILTVAPAPLTVTAYDQARLFGQSNPLLTFGATGFKLGDTERTVLSGTPATAADSASPAGTYPITRGSLATNANYAMDFVDGRLTVIAAAPAPAVKETLAAVNSATSNTVTGTMAMALPAPEPASAPAASANPSTSSSTSSTDGTAPGATSTSATPNQIASSTVNLLANTSLPANLPTLTDPHGTVGGSLGEFGGTQLALHLPTVSSPPPGSSATGTSTATSATSSISTTSSSSSAGSSGTSTSGTSGDAAAVSGTKGGSADKAQSGEGSAKSGDNAKDAPKDEKSSVTKKEDRAKPAGKPGVCS